MNYVSNQPIYKKMKVQNSAMQSYVFISVLKVAFIVTLYVFLKQIGIKFKLIKAWNI